MAFLRIVLPIATSAIIDLEGSMSAGDLKTARLNAGWSQQQAATRLGVSQPYYSQMERGSRPLPDRLVARAVRKLHLEPTALPIPPLASQLIPIAPAELASALARLGYKGFAHMGKRPKAYNPAYLVAGALVHADLDVRIVEALPWVLSTFHQLDWAWLIAECRLSNLQNRLGYLVVLARQIGNSNANANLTNGLCHLEQSRLASEGTLCRESMSDAERKWVRKHRSQDATHWSLLTTLTADQLSYAA
jgi:transcriptional regulator with XRE-family HTH domain